MHAATNKAFSDTSFSDEHFNDVIYSVHNYKDCSYANNLCKQKNRIWQLFGIRMGNFGILACKNCDYHHND